jgi:hypothetical protein
MAIASLVCGIVGPCTVGLCSVIGLILGIVGLVKIGKEPAAKKGRGLAIAGIAVSGVGVLILPILIPMLAAILLPAIFGAMDLANSTSPANNVHQLCMAAEQYAASHGGKLPPADTWPEALKEGGYISDAGVLTCPGKENAGRTYAMNAKLGGMRIEQVHNQSQTVLFFECSPGAPPSGGPSDLPPEPPHTGGWTIGFCDGHTELVPLNRRDQLIWDPKAE